MAAVTLVRENGRSTKAQDEQPSALKIRGLTVSYASKPVIFSVDASFQHGRMAAIIGPNGAGKSTFLKASLDLIPALSGEVEAFGEPVAKVRQRIAYVPQRNDVDWDFPTRVVDVVMMGLYPRFGLLRRLTKGARDTAYDALEKVGMREFSDRQIGALSGGQQQRVFLARAMTQQADLILLDEPFSGVDMATEKAIVTALFSLRDQGKTIIAVHHDLTTVQEYFDDVLLLNRHKISQGPVCEAFTVDFLQQAYRGQLTPQTGWAQARQV